MSITKTNSSIKLNPNQHMIQSLKHLPQPNSQHKVKIQSRNHYISLSPLLTLNQIKSITNSTLALTINGDKHNSNHTFRKTNKRNKNNYNLHCKRKLHLSPQVNTKVRPESNVKLRKTKLKIHKIIKSNPLNQCFSFNNKNSDLNTKLFDHIESDYYHKRQLTYHSHFRFDKNELGETHNRLSLIMKYKPLNLQLLNPIQQIGSMLNEEEKKMVMLDPNYFFKENNCLLSYNLFKTRSLSETLENEAKPQQNTLFSLNNSKNNFYGFYRNYEPNYTFNVPCSYMEHEIEEKHKVMESISKRLLNKNHDDRLNQLSNKKMTAKELINKDITKMIREINVNTNKSIKLKSRFKKKDKDEEDNEEKDEISYKESRSKCLMKNFLRLRSEDRDASKREMIRNRYVNNPISLRYYVSEITDSYNKPKVITHK